MSHSRPGRIGFAGDTKWVFRLEGDPDIDLFYEWLDGDPPQQYSLDMAVIGSLLTWMSSSHDSVVIDGPVSWTLLKNLHELQLVWSCWRPKRYHPVRFIADDVVRDQPTGAGAVVSFSGGVDSAFSVYRHSRPTYPTWSESLKEAVLVHGFDIPLDHVAEFERARRRAEDTLGSVGIPLRSVRTNVKRDLPQSWVDCFGLAVSSVLVAFQTERLTGLIPSSEPYGHLVFPWGSTPVQDWMASTGAMEIRHDGAGFSRPEKIAAIAKWPEGLTNLRVCWEGPAKDRNCGQCEKCIRTMLGLRLAGVGTDQFDSPLSDSRIEALRLRNAAVTAEFEAIVLAAREAEVDDALFRAARRMLARNKARARLSAVKSRAARLVRG